MAQCPKCKEPIGKWQVFKTAYFATRKHEEIDCPKCGELLEVKGSLQPGASIAFIAMLVGIIIFAFIQRHFFHYNQQMVVAYLLIICILLINIIYQIAKALGARLEALPEPKKFYDPDRLD